MTREINLELGEIVDVFSGKERIFHNVVVIYRQRDFATCEKRYKVRNMRTQEEWEFIQTKKITFKIKELNKEGSMVYWSD